MATADTLYSRPVERIAVKVRDYDASTYFWKAFSGIWLIAPNESWCPAAPDAEDSVQWALALTSRGAVVTYAFSSDGRFADLAVFRSFEVARGDYLVPRALVDAAMRRLDEQFVLELDV
jgi:hypothetical protein